MSDIRPKFFVPSSIKFVVDVMRGEYSLPASWSLPDYVSRDGPIVLDIGANIGAFVIWTMQKWPNAIVHCYEPHPKLIPILKSNVERFNSVFVHPMGVGPTETGKEILYEGVNATCGSNFDLGNQQSDKSFFIDMMRPDQLPACDILKLDTEGQEPDILREYKYLDLCKAVMLEWHRPQDKWITGKLLVDAGLRCVFDGQSSSDCGVTKWVRT